MRTVRRLYFYLVAFISLEVILWGVINLARTLFTVLPSGGMLDQLAGGISLVLVGVPIFLLHWAVVQRDAQRDEEEERASRIRALFLYGVRLATWIPMVQNLLAILNRLFLQVLQVNPTQALIGARQNLADNLVAIAANVVFWVYFERVLRGDWPTLARFALSELRRLFRYVWMLYNLVLMIAGIQFLVWYLLALPQGVADLSTTWLGNGLALTLVAAPLWSWGWLTIQNSLGENAERRSLLRLGVLYLLALVGAVTALIAWTVVLAGLLDWLLGTRQSLAEFLNNHSTSLATSLNFGVLWAYFGRILLKQISDEADPFRQATLRQIYTYILALTGFGLVFFGIESLLVSVIDLLFDELVFSASLRYAISAGLASLAIGLPVWLSFWPKLQAEARQDGEAGDHARRSALRKGYLYLLLFLGVLGVMGTAGFLFYQVLTNLLGVLKPDFWRNFAQALQALGVVALWLAYYLRVLIQDGRKASRALGERYSGFPVVVFQKDEETFATELVAALGRQAPGLPVIVHRLAGQPLEDLPQKFRAVILPASLALSPPEALRQWLAGFNGQRVIVPLPEEGFAWLGSPARSSDDWAKEAARAVRQLAEGRPVRAAAPAGTWAVIGYVLGALFALQLLFALTMLILSTIRG